MASSPGIHGNQLLAALLPADRDLIEPHLEPRLLNVFDDLELPEKAIDWVYFPDSGLVSIVAMGEEEKQVEVGIVGREGVSGSAVILGGISSPHHSYVQVAGGAQRIGAHELQEGMGKSASLAALLLRFVQVLLVQTAHTATANARGTLEERLARWLLMAHDRAEDDNLALTHQFISLMLGVRRAGVTECVQVLEGDGLIRASRGRISVRNRRALERKAGVYYGTPEAEYRRLIG